MTSLVFPVNSNCVLEPKQGKMETLWWTKVECEKKKSHFLSSYGDIHNLVNFYVR